MTILKKLDPSSKLLILISVVGIVLALFGFYLLNNQSAENSEDKDLVGFVTFYQNDTRVKRSGNIHWYPVNQKTNCFEDDLVFTGNDSTATVELPTGDKILLHPNSLIALSKDLISLESGAIEIDLSTGSAPVKLESFGEKIILKQKSKVRVIHNEKTQKIVPLNEVAKTIQAPAAIKELIEMGELSITSPQVGALYPAIDEFIVNLSWSSTKPSSEYTVSFSSTQDGAPFLTLKSNTQSLAVPLKNFSSGMVYWKVTANDKSFDQSNFTLTKDYSIQLNYPADKDNFPLPTTGPAIFTPDWSAALAFPQKLQVALDSSFTKLIFDELANSSEKQIQIQKEGQYFWRVGYQFQKDLYHWSTASEFYVKADVVISPIEIKLSSNTFDFSLNPSYKAEVMDPNKCDSYNYIVLKGQEIVKDSTSNKATYKFNKLEDGKYTLKVIGSIKNKPVVENSTEFEVKTSGPLKAPKIIKKNRKLFVKLMESVFNFIIPSSMAADEAVAQLDWEGPEGVTYEVEISKTVGTKPLVKKEVTQTNVNFVVPKPGIYFWRVRYKEGTQWSPFSDYDEIRAEDKVQLINSPLMISPTQNASVALENGTSVQFNWTVPYPELEYVLEIYGNPTGKPLKTIPVTGNSKILKFKDKLSTFYWKVVAKSSYGNSSMNNELYKFTISPKVIESPAKSKSSGKGELILTGQVSQSSMSYDQKIDDSNLVQIDKKVSLSGQTFWLNAEYWFGFGSKKNGLSLGLDKSSLSAGTSKYDELEIVAEYGRKLTQSEKNFHKAFIGFHSSRIDLTVDSSIKSNYSTSYLSGRYNFKRILTDKWSMGLDTELLLLLLSEFASPSLRLRPAVYYSIRKNLWVNGFFGFERNIAKPQYDEAGVKGNLNITSQVMNYGLGLTWQH